MTSNVTLPREFRKSCDLERCFLAWFLARTVRGYFKPAEEEEEPEEKSKSD